MNPADTMHLSIHLTTTDWLTLFTHFLSLSLLAIGGAITAVPDMHRYFVNERHWLTDSQFASSIALAQAAPGPNVLFIALMGWNIGINAAGGAVGTWSAWCLGLMGMLIAMLGMLVPSTTLALLAARWGHNNRELRAVRAFKQGLAPIVVALMAATGWILADSHGNPLEAPVGWLLAISATVLVWRTRLHMLWMLAAGGLAGALGWV